MWGDHANVTAVRTAAERTLSNRQIGAEFARVRDFLEYDYEGIRNPIAASDVNYVMLRLNLPGAWPLEP
jgi:hypothetical protein